MVIHKSRNFNSQLALKMCNDYSKFKPIPSSKVCFLQLNAHKIKIQKSINFKDNQLCRKKVTSSITKIVTSSFHLLVKRGTQMALNKIHFG